MKRDLGSVLDIVAACRDIEEFLTGKSRHEFLDSKLLQAAVVRKLEVIGEATKRLSVEFRSAMPEVPWSRMAGMRDWLIHGYDRIDIEKVWSSASEEVPKVRAAPQGLVSALEPDVR